MPFYANFKTGLEDGAKQFGFTYDLVDGNSGDVATELANLQNFIAQKKDLIFLTPSGEGIIPGIKLVNDANIPFIEVNNKAGFGSREVNVLTYVGADDVEFGRLEGKLVDQAFGGKKAKVAYVMGFAGTSPQILRAKGWDEFRAQHPQYEEVARFNDDFDAAKALAVVQDLLSRFPKGQLDAIVIQGPKPARRRFRPAQRPRRNQIHRGRLSGGCPTADLRRKNLRHRRSGSLSAGLQRDENGLAALQRKGRRHPQARFPALAAGDEGERREDAGGLGLLTHSLPWLASSFTTVAPRGERTNAVDRERASDPMRSRARPRSPRGRLSPCRRRAPDGRR